MNRYQQAYNRLELPQEELKSLKIKLKMWDKETMSWIIDYLRIDSFKLTQWIAQTINKDNASDVIAYKDWALWRNEVLIKLLKESTKEKKYFDKMKQELKKVI